MKLFTYDTFKFDLWRVSFLRSLNPIMAIAVPLIELLVAVSLMFSKTRRVGLYGSFILMIIFTAYVGLLLSTVKHLPCTCGGVLRDMSWGQHLWFNIFFTILAFIGIRLHSKIDKGSWRKSEVAFT
jgi:hypothetical protein